MVRFKDRHHQKTVFTSKVATNWISQIGQQVLGFLQNRAEMGFVTSQQVVKIVCLLPKTLEII